MTIEITTPEAIATFDGVILFSAPWCGPCKVYKPALIAFCEQSNIPLGLVDIQAYPALAALHGLRSIPTTMYFEKGTHVRTQLGAMPDQALIAFVA